jgi:non-homologous end joining protein Ku
MSHSNNVGLGRVTILTRDGPALAEPRGAGLVMSTLRSANEVHPAKFGAKGKSEIDVDMVVIADGIIECRLGAFSPTSFQDRYQDAPRELVSCGRRTVQIHQSDVCLETQPRAGRRAGSEDGREQTHAQCCTGVRQSLKR